MIRDRAAAPLLATTLAVLAALAALAGCGATPDQADVTPQRKAELSKEWDLYRRNDPEWPKARERWLQGPQLERDLLLDNLLIELLSDDAAARGNATSSRSTRARKEITWFGSDAVPPLLEGMKGLAVRETVDPIAIDRIGRALVDLHALDAVIELVEQTPKDAANQKVRRAGLLTLAMFDDVKATDAIATLLRDDPAWQVRAAAAEALQKRLASGNARAALVQALGDADGFVRAKALPVLVAGLDPAVDPAALERLVTLLLEDPSPAARGAAAESLALFAYDRRVTAALVRALADHDPNVVPKAAHALVNVETTGVQLALVDALERAVQQRQEGLVSELLLILSTNVGARPKDINPAGWRALIAQRAGKH